MDEHDAQISKVLAKVKELDDEDNTIVITTEDAKRIQSGDHRRGETHVPIPNTTVKTAAADGSAAPMLCESSLSPGLSAA